MAPDLQAAKLQSATTLKMPRVGGRVKSHHWGFWVAMSAYRLGLDLGTNSIGWCAVGLDADGNPDSVLDAGVRILSPNEEAGRDPQSSVSLAAARRLARGQRRRRKRFVRRRQRLTNILVRAGLMPKDTRARKELETLDPYWLRSKALDCRIEPSEIGRVIFHLNQRRGFKSSRIADSESDDKSAMKQGIRDLEDRLKSEGARTLGEFLAMQHGRDRTGKRGKGVRAQSVRFRPETKGTKNLYDLYPTRLMLEQELDAIWNAQKSFRPDLLTNGLLNQIKRIVIQQRPLKRPIVGNCSFNPEEKRVPKAHPLFQKFRIQQDVCQLRVSRPGHAERPLRKAEFDYIVRMLSLRSSLTVKFESIRTELRNNLGFPDDARFNYERTNRSGFKSDETARVLAHKKAFGPVLRNWPIERQIEIVEELQNQEDEDDLCDWLVDKLKVCEETAKYVSEVRLPQGHGSFGPTILRRLTEVLEHESKETHDPDSGEIYRRPLTYNEAMEELDLHHSDRRPRGAALNPKLPYYGEILPGHVISQPPAPEGSQERIGRVPNPTVHIAINQLRKVINTLIDAYGPPREIAIELARELKLNKQRKDEINRKNRINAEKNEKFRKEMETLGIADTHDSRLLLRLYDELPPDARICVYSGNAIGKKQLFRGEIEIDHILPYSQTLDDSFPNKVLCTREMNRHKGNRAPAEAWDGRELKEICERAEKLFPYKAWRFGPGAIDRFEVEGGFLARQLTDTQHMSRLAKTYLEHVCESVRASPGRLTAMLRGRWGLNGMLGDHNRKNRSDHRHHAIDAFVVACTDRGLLNRIARESGRAADNNLDRLFHKGDFPIPFRNYFDALKDRLDTMIVSHKPDHGLPPNTSFSAQVTSGKLLEDTAYGLVDEEIGDKQFNLVVRRPLRSLTPKMIDQVRDPHLRKDLQLLAGTANVSGQKLDQALAEFSERRDVRHVRVLATEQTVRIVRHGKGHEKAYVPGENHCIEIFQEADGAWRGEGISVFDANQANFVPRWPSESPKAHLVMRVHRGDLVEADFGDGRKIYIVCSLDASANRLKLALHHEGGSLGKRHNDADDPFQYEMKAYSRLKAAGARRVRIDAIGRVSPAS